MKLCISKKPIEKNLTAGINKEIIKHSDTYPKLCTDKIRKHFQFRKYFSWRSNKNSIDFNFRIYCARWRIYPKTIYAHCTQHIVHLWQFF